MMLELLVVYEVLEEIHYQETALTWSDFSIFILEKVPKEKVGVPSYQCSLVFVSDHNDLHD